MICPKCQHEPQEHDRDTMAGVCPACGIAYAKWQPEDFQDGIPPEAELPESKETLSRRIYYYVFFMPSDRDESAFWGHLVIYVWFFIWGWRFILAGIDWTVIGDSFLHYVNLPFHEYGHIFFRPFGDVWMLMGGSLFQIMVPLAPLAYFMIWQRDNFAASLMLWWCGQNFIDVAPYVADAPTRYLPLISGIDESHDWWNVLNMTGTMEHAQTFASIFFFSGVLVMILSQCWGALLLYIEAKGRIAKPEL
ncbi:MAG: hypothetical protein CMQ38_08630 [Gammaproteobacteria bacterium]|nr:hypothetical protein [Gammaproteobacteria bacterium]|tara:strand:- start:1770 stop:2516 length:747 start_codon:yes stop_codon:yes gene_type:complete